jgi:hypothetical protein
MTGPEQKHKLAQERRWVQLVRKMVEGQQHNWAEERTMAVEQRKLVEEQCMLAEERGRLAEVQGRLAEERDRPAVGRGRLAEELLHKRELKERHKKPLVPSVPWLLGHHKMP